MLNISRQIQTGWNGIINGYPLPEAEIIPLGISANEKKKLEKITSKYTVTKELENIPLPGFTLYKANRKNWGSIDQTWLVIDPRGFLVRISNENLETILHVTGITEGLIQEKCVWAREDTRTKMSLVPVSSPLYIAAENNTVLLEEKVDFKTVNIGDTVLLQNGLTGIYRGVMSLYCPIENYSRNKIYTLTTLLRRQVLEVGQCQYHYQSDLKILKVIKKTDKEFTREDSVAQINMEIANKSAYMTNSSTISSVSSYNHYSNTQVRHVSIHAVQQVKMSLEEIDITEATELLLDASQTTDMGKILLEHNNKSFVIDFVHISSNTPARTSFQVAEINQFNENGITLVSGRNYGNTTMGVWKLDMFTKFYKIVKHVKSNTYI